MGTCMALDKKGVKVNYNNYFSEDGTHYDQMVTVGLTKQQVSDFNNMVIDARFSDTTDSDIRLYLKRVAFGINYTNLTTFRYFYNFFHLSDVERIKSGRNTILVIKKV